MMMEAQRKGWTYSTGEIPGRRPVDRYGLGLPEQC